MLSFLFTAFNVVVTLAWRRHRCSNAHATVSLGSRAGRLADGRTDGQAGGWVGGWAGGRETGRQPILQWERVIVCLNSRSLASAADKQHQSVRTSSLLRADAIVVGSCLYCDLQITNADSGQRKD